MALFKGFPRDLGRFVVHPYVYDVSKPDTIRIKVLFGEGSGEERVRRCTARAEHHAIEAAREPGWLNWLKIEHEEQKVTNMFASDKDSMAES
jgi:hypothetical protein